MILDMFFDRVVILTLKGNEDRAIRAKKELESKSLSAKAEIFEGVRGSKCHPPRWWHAGQGAWGCMQSHLRIVQDALMDDVDSVLIIEDDTVWQPQAARLIFSFLAQLPDDWGQIYFGGQHRGNVPPESIGVDKPAVLRGTSVHRTHAYALKKDTMIPFCQHILDAESYNRAHVDKKYDMHVDHQLERAHQRKAWNVYIPSFWLAAQGENRSDINKRFHPEKWWHVKHNKNFETLPLIICSEKKEKDFNKRLHFGNHISDSDPTVDYGLRDSPIGETHGIIKMIAREAYAHQQLPAMHNFENRVETLQSSWKGPILYAKDLSAKDLAKLCDYPESKVVKHTWFNP